MNYDVGQPFIEVNFPSRGVKTALFKREDVLRVKETVTPDNEPLVTIYAKSLVDKDKAVEWYFDGTMEEFKKATKTVYL
jgi:hypothetical protein